ncbi:MAPEG family protein [Vannielia litorea]|uniref:Glutathione S-transferase n=1 Tax=Vannielia litorea TaxID=1217970 RepID=A0A1N6G2J0_9RHOB|nr:MAPEG family protein [Vannielia litorea]SIO01728.1 hypothetical protein SAMN05444002_2150 [Vannielia litorea]
MFAITSVNAGLFGILYVALSYLVAHTRRTGGVSLGYGEDRRLTRRGRAHGNFSEYVPIGLILLALTEAQGAPAVALHALALCLLAGRLLHGWAFIGPRLNRRFRVVGMILTLSALLLASLGLLLHALL